MDVSQFLSLKGISELELTTRLTALTRLLDVTRRLADQTDLTRLLELITDEARNALGCDRASLFQYDVKRDELYTSVATELEIAEIRHSTSQGITGFVARNRVLANIADPSLDPRWNSRVDRATGYHTRNILAMPLASPHDGKLLGVLQLLNKEDGTFDAFDEQLALAFSHHAAAALDRARMVDELRKGQAVEASLNLAREIQRGFMPRQLPHIPGYEVATWWFANQAVGGDYCDVVSLGDGRIGLVIADVSGHGLGPSLIMASVRAALCVLLLKHTQAEVLLALLGRALAPDLQNGLFITMVLAAVDPTLHVVDYANAGHAPAEHFSAATGKFTSLESTGWPLGVEDRPEFPQTLPIRLEVGDIIVLCTDGIVEAINAENQQFGHERLETLIAEYHRAPIDELVRRIGKEVEGHYVGDNPPDDLTILALRRNE